MAFTSPPYFLLSFSSIIINMEYYKVYCDQHPYEAVTNFCADSECLVGLCATCICEHTQQHLKKGTSPRYQNIKNTYVKYNDRMREQIDKIQQDKEWLNDVCFKIDQKRKNVRATIAQARQDSLALVNAHFDDLEGKIQNQITNQGKRNSLHSAYRLQVLNTLLLKEISNLLLYSKDLSSSKFIETARQVQKDIFPNSNEFHLRVSKQLKQNQVYTASLLYRQDMLSQLAASLKKLINLEFLLPRVQYIETVIRQPQPQMQRSQSVKKVNNSMILQGQTWQIPDFAKKNCSMLNPKHTVSVIIPSQPFQVLTGNRNQSQIVSPTCLNKSSRLSSGLRIIRESKRQNSQGDQSKSLTSSLLSLGKQNDQLAHSTYYDSGSNFFK